jgi:thioredoxin-related protein
MSVRPNGLVVTVAIVASMLCRAQTSGVNPVATGAAGQSSPFQPVTEFDETRDARADIRAALREAQQTHRRVLLYIGGRWCPYCAQMDDLFRKHSDLLQRRNGAFVTVPVAYGFRADINAVVAGYGKVLGVPHFFVLDENGQILHSQHLVDLREDGTYSPEKMSEFLHRWSPAAAQNAEPVRPEASSGGTLAK